MKSITNGTCLVQSSCPKPQQAGPEPGTSLEGSKASWWQPLWGPDRKFCSDRAVIHNRPKRNLPFSEIWSVDRMGGCRLANGGWAGENPPQQRHETARAVRCQEEALGKPKARDRRRSWNWRWWQQERHKQRQRQWHSFTTWQGTNHRLLLRANTH